MFSVVNNIRKISWKNSVRFVSSAFIGKNSVCIAKNNVHIMMKKAIISQGFSDLCNVKYIPQLTLNSLELKRYFSKKKGSKRVVEEEESDSEEEEEYEEDIEAVGDSLVTKNVSSIRVDSILKAGLGITKKKIEQDFYAFKLRVNGNRVLKKSMNVYVGDEIDRIRGFSPDTNKFLIVDRIILKGIGTITGSAMYPVKMEVLKQLTVENYEDPWAPTDLGAE